MMSEKGIEMVKAVVAHYDAIDWRAAENAMIEYSRIVDPMIEACAPLALDRRGGESRRANAVRRNLIDGDVWNAKQLLDERFESKEWAPIVAAARSATKTRKAKDENADSVGE